jgi:P27 family predicted phage terminase small subunit
MTSHTKSQCSSNVQITEITVAKKRNEHNAPEEKASDSEKRPVVAEETKPVAIVECPAELSPLAREEWDRIAPELTAAGRLTPFDRAALAAYCTAYAVWVEAVDGLQKYGTVMKSPNGHPVQSLYLSIVNRQVEIMIRIASEFGFTPASRCRLPSPSKGNSILLELTSLADLDYPRLE